MKIPDHIQQAIQAYYAERVTDDEVAALEAWFREDEANLRIFAEHGMVEWHLLCEQEKADAAAILTILREAEEKAEPDFSLLQNSSFQASPGKSAKPRITARELWSLAGYLAAKGMRSKAGVIGSIAAILLLGAVLMLVILGQGRESGTPETAGNPPNLPSQVGPASPVSGPTVATLTAQHDTLWQAASGTAIPGVGDGLVAGQRLVLTEGLAEVTTARGASVILEAPCEVAFSESDNALRLVSGRLYAVVPGPASGFEVQTPAAQIVDIGTEFGVSVDAAGTVGVRVFTGLVEVSTGPKPSDKHPLLEGELARVHSRGVEKIEYDATLDFQTSMPSREITPRLTGQVRWLSAPPPSIEHSVFTDPYNAYLFLEKEKALIPAGTEINSSDPSKPIRADKDRAVVEEETVVDAYILHFDPDENGSSARGTIVFDRPIIGVITNHILLKESDQHCAHPQVNYGVTHPTRGLEQPGVRIGPDGRSLMIDIEGFARQSDHLRILVAAKDGQP